METTRRRFICAPAAYAHSTHHCARAVADAIRAGGIRIEGADAKNFWRSLENAGFTKVSGTLIEGDVAVIDALPGHNQYGHAAFMMVQERGIQILSSAACIPVRVTEPYSQQ